MDCEEIPGILCVRVWWRKSKLPRGPGLACGGGEGGGGAEGGGSEGGGGEGGYLCG